MQEDNKQFNPDFSKRETILPSGKKLLSKEAFEKLPKEKKVEILGLV